MEYMCGGGLHSRLLSEGKMKESDAKIIFAQLLSAVRHLVGKIVEFIWISQFWTFCIKETVFS